MRRVDHVARLDEGVVVAAARRAGHGLVAEADELVDVELVVGEQHEVLEVLGVGAGVVAQAVQRVVDARRGEQRERLRLAGARDRRCRWRCRRPSRRGRAGRTGRAAAGAAPASGCPRCGRARRTRSAPGSAARWCRPRARRRGSRSSRRNCSQVVAGEQVGPRQRRLVGARAGDEAVAAGASRRARRCRCGRARTDSRRARGRAGAAPLTNDCSASRRWSTLAS